MYNIINEAGQTKKLICFF